MMHLFFFGCCCCKYTKYITIISSNLFFLHAYTVSGRTCDKSFACCLSRFLVKHTCQCSGLCQCSSVVVCRRKIIICVITKDCRQLSLSGRPSQSDSCNKVLITMTTWCNLVIGCTSYKLCIFQLKDLENIQRG